jgi:hypothetical protein
MVNQVLSDQHREHYRNSDSLELRCENLFQWLIQGDIGLCAVFVCEKFVGCIAMPLSICVCEQNNVTI